MKYVDEYRAPALIRELSDAIARITTRPWALMEVCGGQTHAILKHGLDRLIPAGIELLHGPGCPVCVTPAETLDLAFALALEPRVIFCTFGDMLRVPGSEGVDLYAVRAHGGDVRMVYSPLDAVALAQRHPDREVILFAVGFETTAPANALAVERARRLELQNFSLLVSHVLVPPALESILRSPSNRVQAFLAAGHVCTVMGYQEYEPIAARHRVPIVVTGFEPADLLEGIYLSVRQLEEGRAEVENQYARSVMRDGNRPALELVRKVFDVSTRAWRGMGSIPQSGLVLSPAYARFDAERRFPREPKPTGATTPATACISGEILLGAKKPPQCPSYGTACTPERPLGATMVSNEGACAAYYRYRAHDLTPNPEAADGRTLPAPD